MIEKAPANRLGIMNGQLFMILLPAFYLMHNYNEVFGFMPIHYPIKYTMVIYTFLTILYFAGSYLLKSRAKSTLILFLLMLLILFFGPMHSAAKNLTPGNFFGRYLFFLPTLLLITPVNIFRIIFNQFFLQRLPLLKDSLVSVKWQ